MKKIGKFFKNYGFYLAIGVICIGALAAIFWMPNNEGNINNQTNPYAKDQTADGSNLQETNEKDNTDLEEDDLDTTDEMTPNNEVVETGDESDPLSEQTDEENEAQDMQKDETNVSDAETANNQDENNEQAAVDDKVQTETFESTTASVSEEPFFAEGDTVAWPVEGNVVVPYTDESTSHWYSESLNQTMRTFGVCISAPEGTEVKAVAKGTVLEIVEDSSTYFEPGMPYVGKLMVVDLGNGYKSIYGFQGGTVNEDLVGKVVNPGDVLGTVGTPKGAFISEGDNIYLQMTHNDKVINPLGMLETNDNTPKQEGVDVGFSK